MGYRTKVLACSLGLVASLIPKMSDDTNPDRNRKTKAHTRRGSSAPEVFLTLIIAERWKERSGSNFGEDAKRQLRILPSPFFSPSFPVVLSMIAVKGNAAWIIKYRKTSR